MSDRKLREAHSCCESTRSGIRAYYGYERYGVGAVGDNRQSVSALGLALKVAESCESSSAPRPCPSPACAISTPAATNAEPAIPDISNGSCKKSVLRTRACTTSSTLIAAALDGDSNAKPLAMNNCPAQLAMAKANRICQSLEVGHVAGRGYPISIGTTAVMAATM